VVELAFRGNMLKPTNRMHWEAVRQQGKGLASAYRIGSGADNLICPVLFSTTETFSAGHLW